MRVGQSSWPPLADLSRRAREGVVLFVCRKSLSNNDPLDLIDGEFVAFAVIELWGPWRFVGRNRLDILDRPAIL